MHRGAWQATVQWNIIHPLKNEIMTFAATWVDLEIVILSKEVREGQISYDMAYIWNLFLKGYK